MSSNDRHGRQSLGSDGSGHGDASSLLDAIFNLSQGGQQPGPDGGTGTGEASQMLLPFSQQQPGLSLEATQGRQSLEELHRTSFQTPLSHSNLPSFPNFSNLPSLPNLHNFPPQQNQAAPFNPFSLTIPPAPFNSPARGPASFTNSSLYSTSLPSLASPTQSSTTNKLNNLRLAIATRDPTESVEDVLSPRSLSFLHSHFQSMGVELPASASWGQIQQLLGQPRTPRSGLQTSSSMFSERGGGLGPPPQETPSLLSSFPAQDNVQWNIPPPPPPGSGESVLDRFLATVNLPANETNARITKLAANLILQQQQQQQEQQRLLRQQQIRQLQESFHLHSQIPPLPTFQQQPSHHPPSLANFGGLGGNISLGAGLLNPSHDPSAQISPMPPLPGLSKLTPQMTELWQSALSKENQGSLSAFLNTQKFAAATAQQLGRGGLQSPGYSVPDQVAQVIVGQQHTLPQRVQGLSATQGGGSSEQGRQGHQNLSSLVAPLTSDAMRRALMAGGALSAQPAETSM